MGVTWDWMPAIAGIGVLWSIWAEELSFQYSSQEAFDLFSSSNPLERIISHAVSYKIL